MNARNSCKTLTLTSVLSWSDVLPTSQSDILFMEVPDPAAAPSPCWTPYDEYRVSEWSVSQSGESVFYISVSAGFLQTHCVPSPFAVRASPGGRGYERHRVPGASVQRALIRALLILILSD